MSIIGSLLLIVFFIQLCHKQTKKKKKKQIHFSIKLNIWIQKFLRIQGVPRGFSQDAVSCVVTVFFSTLFAAINVIICLLRNDMEAILANGCGLVTPSYLVVCKNKVCTHCKWTWTRCVIKPSLSSCPPQCRPLAVVVWKIMANNDVYIHMCDIIMARNRTYVVHVSERLSSRIAQVSVGRMCSTDTCLRVWRVSKVSLGQ